MYFGIANWSAWVAGVTSEQELREWAKGSSLPATSEFPQVEFVPKMHRRRLSALAKMALSRAEQIPDYTQLPSVFCSRHGDLPKTLELLRDVGTAQPLSPTAFALSVHNAVSGQFGIYSGNQQPTTLISGGRDSFFIGLLEALLRMRSQQQTRMLYVYADMPLPVPYDRQADELQIPHAIALEITAIGDYSLDYSAANGAGISDVWPLSLAFLRQWLVAGKNCEIEGQRHSWSVRHG